MENISNTTRWVLGHKVTPHNTTGNYDLMIAESPPHASGPPPHLHNSLEESFLIIEGEMEFIVNNKKIILRAGDSLDIPPKTVHTFSNTSNKPCKWINIHSPKGFRAFFEAFGIAEKERDAIEKSIAPEIINEVITTASNYDMIIKT